MAYKDDGKPFCMASFGMQDAGKTYDLERWANSYRGLTKIAYNYGRATDWKGYEDIELLMSEGILHFNWKGKNYPFERDFMHKFRQRAVKIKQAFDREVETLFFRILSSNDSFDRFVLTLDDATGIFGNTLTRAERIMLSRTKHKGCKLAFSSHDFFYFPKQAWGLLTHIRVFKTLNAPPKARKEDISTFDILTTAYELLQTAPTYSYCTIQTGTGELFYQEFQPKKTKPPKPKKTSK